jgi:hypothetical protein
MRRKDNIERLDEALARCLRRKPETFDFDEWAQNHPDAAALIRSGFAQHNSRSRIQFAQIWRCIMQSSYTRYVSAGIVLLALLGFLFPGGNGNLALADVQKAMEEMQTARFTGVRNVFLGDNKEPVHKLTVEKLFWIYHGCVDRTFEDGKLVIEFTCHVPTGTATVLFPQVKRYYHLQIPEDRREELRKITPDGLFETLFASGNCRKLEPRDIQGVKAIGFEVSDLTERVFGNLGGSQKIADFFFPVRSMSARMWVDPEARLPVLIEAEGEIGPCFITGYNKARLTEINDHWEFGIELDDAQFKPQIPADYQALIPPAAKAGAVLSGVGLASAPIVLLGIRHSRRRRRL